MEHTMFLTQILGCVSAALVVALIWEHHRVRECERRIDRMEGKPWHERKRER